MQLSHEADGSVSHTLKDSNPSSSLFSSSESEEFSANRTLLTLIGRFSVSPAQAKLLRDSGGALGLGGVGPVGLLVKLSNSVSCLLGRGGVLREGL
jgi:hypothetical protein